VKKLLALIAFSVLLLVPVGIQNAFGGPLELTAVSVVFREKMGNCKIFDIVKGENRFGDPILLEKITMNDFGNADILRPSTITPEAERTVEGRSDIFIFEQPVEMATLKVCFEPTELEVEFAIIVDTPLFNFGRLVVTENVADAEEDNDFIWTTAFFTGKEDVDCEDIKTNLVNIVEETFLCQEEERGSGASIFRLSGEVINPAAPAISALSYDPLGDVNLFVTDICILYSDGSFICPENIDVNFPIDLIFIDIAVGGELIPINTTSLLLAGAQMTASWMIPVLVAGAGIGIVISRRF